MQKYFVLAACDVHCDWSDKSPRYRVYVNDELFAERTWIWNGVYLEENIQLEASIGRYKIEIELLDKENATLNVSNLRIVRGRATITPDNEVIILGQD